jgi:hypothetical protein
MMKGNNFLPAALLGLLFVSSVLAGLCALLYVRANGELRSLQAQANRISNHQVLARSLANDALEYSKSNPAINPLLESIGARRPTNR